MASTPARLTGISLHILPAGGWATQTQLATQTNSPQSAFLIRYHHIPLPYCFSPAPAQFGKRLLGEARRRWGAAYLDYRALKAAIKLDVAAQGAFSVVAAVAGAWAGRLAVLPVRQRQRERWSVQSAQQLVPPAHPCRIPPPPAFPAEQMRRAAALRSFCVASCARWPLSMWRRRRSWL